MRIECVLAAALAVSAISCRTPAGWETPRPRTTIATPAVLPDPCYSPLEELRPPGLSREAVATYPGEIVVNRAGGLIVVAVNPLHLQRLDDDPDLGLNFPGHIKIIYFFAGSMSRPDADEQANLSFSTHRTYLLGRFCQEQGRPVPGLLLITLSVADALAEIRNRDPDQLARVLSENYIRRASRDIGDSLGRPSRELSRDVIEEALVGGLPFRIAGWYN